MGCVACLEIQEAKICIFIGNNYVISKLNIETAAWAAASVLWLPISTVKSLKSEMQISEKSNLAKQFCAHEVRNFK